jgi:hypothetical protein
VVRLDESYYWPAFTSPISGILLLSSVSKSHLQDYYGFLVLIILNLGLFNLACIKYPMETVVATIYSRTHLPEGYLQRNEGIICPRGC